MDIRNWKWPVSPYSHFPVLLLLFFGACPIHASSGRRDQQQRERQMQLALEHDPNLQFQCRGPLAEFAACLCNDELQEVACINAQFVDTGIFQYLIGHYDSARRLTFHGNNFQDLPEGSLFGPSNVLAQLRVLNISANYIVNLHRNALKCCPNIEELDLSNNEIVLSEENLDFLSHVPHLKKLYLRKAFTVSLNRSHQFQLMMRLFQMAQLRRLELLDLSYNFFESVPAQLPCPFPSLRHLDLRQNVLSSVSFNSSCLLHSGSINLERNYMHKLDSEFRAFAEQLAAQNPLVQFQLRNSFFCDCNSVPWIRWLREHNAMIDDYRALACSRASPAKLTGARLSEVPVGQLDCKRDLFSNSGAIPWPTPIYLSISFSILYFSFENRYLFILPLLNCKL